MAPDSDRACCSPQSVRAARSACHAAGVPHVTLDLRDRFRSQVVDDFVRGHAAGQTPNPCMRCNGSFRFDALAAFADRVGAPRLATGHYARIVERGGHTCWRAGADPDKDQSYMLARVPEQILSTRLVPAGRPAQDRRRASRRMPPDWPRPAGARARRSASWAGATTGAFLERHGGAGRGRESVVTADGRVIGRHDGVHRFTPGQRKGLGVGGGEALFVLEADAGPRPRGGGATAGAGPQHRHGAARDHAAAHGQGAGEAALPSPALPPRVREVEDGLVLELDEPAYGVAPGQAAVLYDGDVVVGGGADRAGKMGGDGRSTDAWHYRARGLPDPDRDRPHLHAGAPGRPVRAARPPALEQTMSEVVPMLGKASTTLDHVNDELGKVGHITDSAVDAADKLDSTVRTLTRCWARRRGRCRASRPGSPRRSRASAASAISAVACV